jgi:hypothetical protein
LSKDMTPFAELPAALVDEILEQTDNIADQLLGRFVEIKNDRKSLRDKLLQSGLVIQESSLGYPPLPTTCGADGSYAIERLLAMDLVAAAAVAVEGLAPPSEKRWWEQPHHRSFIATEPHMEDTATILRAVMLGQELCLATAAPHDMVMIDGTITLPIIYFNQAISKAPQTLDKLKTSNRLLDDCFKYLEAYHNILTSIRSDKQFVSLPKYSIRNEIGIRFNWPEGYDDRGMLTFLLEPGELVRPHKLMQPDQPWHINTRNIPNEVQSEAKELVDEIVSTLEQVHVFYYKPHPWLPAFRIEVAESVALNSHRLALVVQGLKHQTAISSMLEPYPIYLADRMVKALARTIPAFRQVSTQRISEKYQGNLSDIFVSMHGYRSETGR